MAAVAGGVVTALVGLALGSRLSSFGIGQYAWIGALVLVLLVVSFDLRGIHRIPGPLPTLLPQTRRFFPGD